MSWKPAKFRGRLIKHAEWPDGTWACELYSELLNNRHVDVSRNTEGEVTVNWSAIGSVPVEAAIEYARLIEDATVYATRKYAGTLKLQAVKS